MKKYFLIFSGVLLSWLLPKAAGAVCPVCVVAVGAGVGLGRWLGVDDVISGIWMGGLIVALIVWLLNWMSKKKYAFKGSWLIAAVIFYVLTIVPLYWSGIMGHPLNKLWGVDKLLLGIIIGGLALLAGTVAHNLLKIKHQGKSFFPYQKVAAPLLFMIVVSLIFHYFLS